MKMLKNGWPLWIKANECRYREKDRRLKEQSINGTNNDSMMTEIVRELTAVKQPVKSPVRKYLLGQEESRYIKSKKSAHGSHKRQQRIWCHKKAWPKDQYTWQSKSKQKRNSC